MSRSEENKKVDSLRSLFSMIYGLGYVPRWVVFLIDVSILIFANWLKYLLVSSLNPFSYNTLDFYTRYGIVIWVNITFFLIFRTYSGIVRHSTFIDGIKLLLSTTCSLFLLLAINYSSDYFAGQKIYVTQGLYISHLLAFIMLFLFRIFVKFFFETYVVIKASQRAQRVFVFGTDANAMSVANALKSEATSAFKIVGFVDRYGQNSSKRMLGLPILSLKRKKLHVIMRSMGVEGVIIAERSLSDEVRNIVDECLEYDYKVYTVPSISDWENKKEISQKVKKIEIEDLLERKPIVLDNSAISSQLKGKTVLITGAAGSIGSEITRQVLGFKPQRLIVLDQAETPLHHLNLEIESLDSKSTVNAVVADIRNKTALRRVFELYNPDVVYHAAAYKHVPLMEDNPSQAILTNVGGTKNLADLACEYNVDKFVMVSTDKAVNPSNVMGASKRIAEKYVQTLQLMSREEKDLTFVTKFITTRFGNVLGSNGSVVPLFTKQISEGGPITITHPEIIRYFMTIPEACQLVLEAGAMGRGGEIYIFDMGKPVKIIDLAHKMIKLAGFIPDKDIKIEVVGLRPGEKLYEELLNDSSKTLPTHHHKIMVAQEEEEETEFLFGNIKELIELANNFDNERDELVCKMKKIVPEFISKNSVFEVLDK